MLDRDSKKLSEEKYKCLVLEFSIEEIQGAVFDGR